MINNKNIHIKKVPSLNLNFKASDISQKKLNFSVFKCKQDMYTPLSERTATSDLKKHHKTD